MGLGDQYPGPLIVWRVIGRNRTPRREGLGLRFRPNAANLGQVVGERRSVFTVLLTISVVGIVGFVWASDFNSFELFKAWPREYTALFGLILVFAVFVYQCSYQVDWTPRP